MTRPLDENDLDSYLDEPAPQVNGKSGVPPAADASLPPFDDEFMSQLTKGMEALLKPQETSETPLDPNQLNAFTQQMRDWMSELEQEAIQQPTQNQTTDQVPSQQGSFQSKITETMNKLKSSETVVNSQVEQDIQKGMSFDDAAMEKMMKELEGLMDSGDFSSVLDGVLDEMVSRELLYEPMKDLSLRYPAWISQHREQVSKQDLDRYKQQQDVILDILQVFDSVDGEPVNEEKKKIIDLMQKMQDCGNPPDEIMKELNDAGLGSMTSTNNMPAGVPPDCNVQ